MRRYSVVLAMVGVLGCDEGKNVQHVPIGSSCTTDSTCGTSPYNCNRTYPGGYCQKDCTVDGDCPTDSLCISGECRRTCMSSSACRSTEGYICDVANHFVCDIPSSGDGGTPSD